MSLATRDHFGKCLVELGHLHPEIVVINCDLGSATRTLDFKQAFPRRFIECGIAEANAISLAAGMAQEGMRPVVCSFGHFLTGKFLEIFQSIGLNDAGVVLVGTHAGLAIGKDGPTQMGLRDLALMRLLPNVEIVHPADGLETRQALTHILAGRAPTYLRLCRQPTPELHAQDYRFQQGEPDHLRRGDDLLLIAQGATVHSALLAAESLAREGQHAGVLNLSSLPFRPEALVSIVRPYKRLLIVEDHYRKGGIGEEVIQVLAGQGVHLPFEHVAVSDYAQAAAPEELYQRYQLDPQGIERRFREIAWR